MNEYTDLQVIECNRLHSEEAKSGNDSNFALWTTNLTDIVHLDAGDKVSVHGAMISERGAGQSSSIEIKGINLGTKKTFNYTETEYGNASNHLPSGYDRITCNASDQEVYMRDDTLNFNLQYYQTARGQNYIHLPRKWWYNPNLTDNESQWTTQDNKFSGMVNYFYIIEKDPFSFNQEYYALDDGLGPVDDGTRYFKPKNDNGRYTIMMRDNTYYTNTGAEGQLGGWKDDLETDPVNYNASLGRSRDPENTTYRVYKEFKSLNLPAGFNSPQYIADEITRQLQTIKDETIHKYGYVSASTPADLKEQAVPFYRTISTETYKPFNVANTFRSIHTVNTVTSKYGVIRDGFEEYYNASGFVSPRSASNSYGFDYLSQYHIVGTKRPEIYETGRQINKEYIDSTHPNNDRGIFGTELKNNWLHTSDTFVLKQKYTVENVNNLKAFFDAQAKYPEIFDYFKDTDNEYNDADNINNSRWIHMNRWSNASMTYTNKNEDAMLGDSYYTDRSGSMTDTRVHSLLLPIYYDSNDADTFYELKESTEGTDYSYGLISYDHLGYIKLKSTPLNGVGSAIWTELQQIPTDNYVGALRKCGFDLHFTAPAMKYILPYAGYSPVPSSYQDAKAEGDYIFKPIDYWAGNTTLDGSVFMNKLYIGADAPTLEYDGTNFNLAGLHTPINVPNHNRVNAPEIDPKPDAEQEAGSIIYEINPKEYFNDFTPDRKPYVQFNSIKNGSGDTAIVLNPLNANLEPWRVYDSMCGVFMGDFNLTEDEWSGSLWDLLGFTYKQFNSDVNNRLIKTDSKNINSLSLLTTNAEVDRADSKDYVQNSWETPLYNNMIPNIAQIYVPSNHKFLAYYHPNIQLKSTSNKISAEKLPTRMIRGYYTIRSNVLQDTSFIGGKKNNTQMPIISVVDKQNGDGDFYFGGESGLSFTVTKPVRLASITCSVHDPDGSYANVSEQSTILLKLEKTRNVSFNVVEELLQEEQQSSK